MSPCCTSLLLAVAMQAPAEPAPAQPAPEAAASADAPAAPPAAPTQPADAPTAAPAAEPSVTGSAKGAEHQRRIVVAGFRANGVDPALARQVEDVLAMEVAKFEGVEVVSRSDIEQALDASANAQLVGCQDELCLFDVGKLMPARHLIAGVVGDLQGRATVSATLLDLQEGRAIARAAQPLGPNGDTASAALQTLALALLGASPQLLGADVSVQGEVTADMLERVRVAERNRWLRGRVIGGLLMSASPTAVYGFDPSNVGGAGRADVSWALLPWLWLTGSAGGGYYTGEIRHEEQYLFGELDDIRSASGVRKAQFGVADIFGGVGVELRRPTGLVLPYGRLLATGDYLILDVSDLVYEKDPGTDDPPSPFDESIPFSQSTSFGGGALLAGGVDFVLLDNLGLTVELSAYGKAHALEKIATVSNEEVRDPVAPLFGTQLFVGLMWQL